MSIYLKKTDDGVIAMGDMATVEKFGGTYDTKISESDWDGKYSHTARVDSRGRIVLGLNSDETKEKNAHVIRRERERRLIVDCDSISPLRYANMSNSERNKWAAYRQALLDIPQQSGFPFGGDVDKAPWPTKPE